MQGQSQSPFLDTLADRTPELPHHVVMFRAERLRVVLYAGMSKGLAFVSRGIGAVSNFNVRVSRLNVELYR